MSAKPKPTSRFAKKLLPGLIILIGVLLTLWIQAYSRDGVLFSGDGGLKALVAQRLAQQLSDFSFPLDVALNMPVPDWVEAVWQEGLYPFTPPYVYQVGSQRFITFPFTFPAVTAPFYALFSDRGLYVVPIVSLWAIWFRFIQVGRRAAWSTTGLCLGLVALIFASPLTFYSGTYWEHTLAVALAFWGVTALIFPPIFSQTGSYLSGYRVFVSGVLIGLSVWFRPEFLCLIAAVSLIALIGWLVPTWKIAPKLDFRRAVILIGSMVLTVCTFFALNYGIYGYPLGIHAIQVAEESSIATQVRQAQNGYRQLLGSLWRYFPLAGFVVLAALMSPEIKRTVLKKTRPKGTYTHSAVSTDRSSLNVATRCLLALSILFILSVPLIVPPGAGGKQWGPRFYLIVVPMLSIVLVQQLQIGFFRPWARRAALVFTALILAISIYTNTVQGLLQSYEHPKTKSVSLAANYEPIAPAIVQLNQTSPPWIAMSHQYVAQQLWSALPEKIFFRAETMADVERLADALTAQNETAFTYVCYPHRDCPVPEENSDRVTFNSMGSYGKYPLYKVEITQ